MDVVLMSGGGTMSHQGVAANRQGRRQLGRSDSIKEVLELVTVALQ
jgi:hypothetical protein